MGYRIITDVTCDLPVKCVKKYDLTVMPMKYTIGGKDYVNYSDFREQSADDFFKLMETEYDTHTCQLNSVDFKEFYEKYLKKGEDILGLIFSSALSGSYNSARIAVDELKEEYPDRKIIIVDTLAASTGEGLICIEAALNKKNGMTIEENASHIEKMKLNVSHWFTVDTIEYLRRGGRVSNTQAFAAKLLNIKPVMHVNNLGQLIPVYKRMGRKTSIKEMAKQYEKTVDRTSNIVIISHAACLDDALYLKGKIENVYKPKEIIIANIGTVIGAHSGPGTLALYFKATHR